MASTIKLNIIATENAKQVVNNVKGEVKRAFDSIVSDAKGAASSIVNSNNKIKGAFDVIGKASNKTKSVMSGLTGKFSSAFSSITGSASRFGKRFTSALAGAGGGLKGLLAKIKSFASGGESILKTFAGKAKGLLMGALAIAGVAGMGAFAHSVVGAASEMETFTAQFEVFYGSAAKAQEKLQMVREVAATTPFQLPQVIRATRTLKVLTNGVLDTAEGLKMVGDASSAAGVPIDELATWFGRLQAGLMANRPVGEAMARLSELGVVSMQTRSQIEDLQKAGVDANTVWQVFANSQKKFQGLMQNQVETWAGITSNIGDYWLEVRTVFGSQFLEQLKTAGRGIRDFLAEFAKSEGIKKLGGIVGDVITGITKGVGTIVGYLKNNSEAIGIVLKVAAAFGALKLALMGARIAAIAFNTAMGPVGLITLAIIAFIEVWRRWGDEIKSFMQGPIGLAIIGFNALKSAFGSVMNFMKTKFSAFHKDKNTDLGGRFQEGVVKAIGAIGKFVNYLIGFERWLIQLYIEIGKGIWESFRNAFDKIKVVSTLVGDVLKSVFNMDYKGLKTAVSNYSSSMDELNKNKPFDGVVDHVQNFKDMVANTDYVGAAIDGLKKLNQKGKEAYAEWKNRKKDTAEGVVDAIQNETATPQAEGETASPAAISGEAAALLKNYQNYGKSKIQLLEEAQQKELKLYDDNLAYFKKQGLERNTIVENYTKQIDEIRKKEAEDEKKRLDKLNADNIAYWETVKNAATSSFDDIREAQENIDRLTEKANKNNLAYWLAVKNNANSTASDIEDAWSNITRIVKEQGVTASQSIALGFEDAMRKAESFSTTIFELGKNMQSALSSSLSNGFNTILTSTEKTKKRLSQVGTDISNSLNDAVQSTLNDSLANGISAFASSKFGLALNFGDKDQIAANKMKMAFIEGSEIAAQNISGAVSGSGAGAGSTGGFAGNKWVAGGITAGLNLIAGSSKPGGLTGTDIGRSLGGVIGTAFGPLGTAIGTVGGGLIGSLFDKGGRDAQEAKDKKQIELLNAIAQNTKESAKALSNVETNMTGLRHDMDKVFQLPAFTFFSRNANISSELSDRLAMASQGA